MPLVRTFEVLFANHLLHRYGHSANCTVCFLLLFCASSTVRVHVYLVCFRVGCRTEYLDISNYRTFGVSYRTCLAVYCTLVFSFFIQILNESIKIHNIEVIYRSVFLVLSASYETRFRYRYRIELDSDIGIVSNSIPISLSYRTRFRYRDRYRARFRYRVRIELGSDIGIESKPIPISVSYRIRFRYRDRIDIQH